MWRAARMNKLSHSPADERSNRFPENLRTRSEKERLNANVHCDDMRNKETFLSLSPLSRSIILVYSTTWLSTARRSSSSRQRVRTRARERTARFLSHLSDKQRWESTKNRENERRALRGEEKRKERGGMTCSFSCVRLRNLSLSLFVCSRLIWTELDVSMADGNSHPFNSEVVASESIVQLHKQSTSASQPALTSKNPQQKHLLDLLASNNTSNHFLNSTDPSLNISSQAVSDDDFSRLKSIVRSTLWPADHHIRRQLWMNILTLNRVSTSKSSHHHTTSVPISTPPVSIDQHLSPLSSKFNQWPSFVDSSNLCFYHLNDAAGRAGLQRILFTFALHHPDLTFCPALQPFSAVLLHYFNEQEVLYLINRLLNKHWLCGETRLQWEANWNVFRKLLRIYYVSSTDDARMERRLISSRNRPQRRSIFATRTAKCSIKNGSGGSFVIYLFITS